MSLPSILGPLPESLRRGVCEAYEKSSYGRFMMCVARVQDGTMSAQDACGDVFNILGYDGGRPCDNGNMHGRPCNNGNMHRDHTSKCRRPDLYRKFVEWSTAAPPVVKEEKTDVPLSRMPGPLPEGLRMAVYESYPALYGRFMVHVVALQEGTMPLKQVDNDVFQILGYDGGYHQKYGKYVMRDASCISHRPDLYQMFVEWSTSAPPLVGNKKHKSVPLSFGVIGLPTAPPQAPCLDSLSSEVLVNDLIALDAAVSMSMSPTMQTALRTGVCVQGVPFSFGAMRELWQKELLKRVSTDTPN